MKQRVRKKASSWMYSNEKELYFRNDPSNQVLNDSGIFNISHLESLSPMDKYLFQRFGQGPITRIPYLNIHQAFENQVRVNPNGTAITHKGVEISFKDLDDQADNLAHKLLQIGVSQGSNVGLFIQRSISMVVGILATLKVGAAYVPQHIGVAPPEQIKHIINTASIKSILTLSEFKEFIPDVPGIQIVEVDDFLNTIEGDPRVPTPLPKIEIHPDDACYIVYTSGTTGMPNGVQVTHRNLCNILLTEPGNLWMRPGVKVGQILNVAFDMAAWEILGSLANGATLVIRGRNIQETVSEVDVVISTPTILSTLDIAKSKKVKVVAVAGEPCPRVLAENWASFCAFYNSCGPTETTIVNTAQRFFPTDNILSIGKPMPNNTVYILDENMQPCKIGEIGEMWAGGSCVSKGYIKNKELTSERYVDDPFIGRGKMFRTRDLGRWTPDGTLEHFGRTDDQVKICGFRIELDSVTSIIEKIPEVKRAVTLKIDDQTLASFVSPETIDKESISENIRKALPYYCVPKKITSMQSLPMTSRGKVDKRELLRLMELEENHNDPDDSKPDGSGSKARITKGVLKDEPPLENIPDLDQIQLPKQFGKFKRMWKGETLMHYYRLMGLFFIVNIGLIVYGATVGNWWSAEHIRWDIFSKISIINFTIGITIRQQYIINFLFWAATSIPTNCPLFIRRRAGKVYHFGGIHIGGNVSGTLWFLIFVGSLYYGFFNNDQVIFKSTSLLWTSTLLSALLVFIIIMAIPRIRAKHHNNFEKSHRFGGWAALVLFWTQTILIIKEQAVGQNMSDALFGSLSFWLLALITFSIALPWLRLKKVKVDLVRPSNHVVLARFNYGVTPFAGSSTAISRNPLMEWHSFANVPEPGRDGYRLTISRSGDWTGRLIDDLPGHLWVKGITTAGVGNIDKLFKRVIWVATGSGIGPCLPHLLSMKVASRLVWATRNPRKTYGDELVEEVLSVQPNAIIWDTDTHGKPDMVKLSYKVYKEFDAEAVICISNKKLTWKVVYGMESRGIPAYGAIWDS